MKILKTNIGNSSVLFLIHQLATGNEFGQIELSTGLRLNPSPKYPKYPKYIFEILFIIQKVE